KIILSNPAIENHISVFSNRQALQKFFVIASVDIGIELMRLLPGVYLKRAVSLLDRLVEKSGIPIRIAQFPVRLAHIRVGLDEVDQDWHRLFNPSGLGE